MKRDKICCIKANSGLIDQFNAIVARDTHRYVFNGRVEYDCLHSKRCRGKFSIADLFEKALQHFISENNFKS